MVKTVNGVDASLLALAYLTAARFKSSAEKQRMRDNPEYRAQQEAKERERAEKEYNALYAAALADNEEYDRSPRAFKRRMKHEAK